MIRLSLTSLLLALPLSVSAQTLDNIQVDRSDIPEAILQTAAYVAPDAIFTEFGIEIELIDGEERRIYELGTHDADGLHLEIDILENGSLQEIEWETPLDMVQTPVQVEFRLHYPEGEITFAERSIRPNGYTVYELEGRDADGQPIDMEVMDNGRGLQVLEEGLPATG